MNKPDLVDSLDKTDEAMVTISRTELTALRDRERQFRTIFDGAAIGIRLGAPDGRAIQSNRALSRMLGYSAAELRKLSHTAFTHPEDAADDILFHEELFRGERNHYKREKRYIHEDGHTVWGSLTVSVVRDDDGTLQFIVGMVEDITERKRVEEDLRQRDAQLFQSQKMEAVGQLAGGIAHDFNNMLTVIYSCSDLVLETMQPDDPARSDIEEIRLASQRAAALTRQLLAFSRKQILRAEVLGVVEVVTRLEHMLRRVLGEDVRLTSIAPPSPGDLRASVDRGQLEQILVNLSINARDAMPAGGDLTISFRSAMIDKESIISHQGCTRGRYVAISVADTGSGMEQAVRERIFEPFFTTKPVGKGTGLGLAVVYGIVQQSGGYIEVESVQGEGTTFTIYLPAADDEVALPAPPVSREREHARVTGAILLVEDDPAVRSVAARVLMAEGYAVHTAANGLEALQILQLDKPRIDLVVTDLVMPEMGGQDLVAQFSKLKHRPRALFMSGYTEDEMLRRGALPPGTSFMEKPFTPDALLRRVRAALQT